MGHDHSAIARWNVEILNYHTFQLNHTMVIDFLRYIYLIYNASEEDLHSLIIIIRRTTGRFTFEEFIQISITLHIQHPTLLEMSKE